MAIPAANNIFLIIIFFPKEILFRRFNNFFLIKVKLRLDTSFSFRHSSKSYNNSSNAWKS